MGSAPSGKPASPNNIILIGFSGTGKSVVGRLLAQRLGREFVDTDEELVARFDKPIAKVFVEEGEPAFRAAERELVAQVCSAGHKVIALGGGAVIDPASRAVISNGNTVIRLEASAEAILQRLQADTDEARPLLADGDPKSLFDPLERIRVLRREREAVYSLFPLTVDTDSLEPNEVVNRVMALLTPRSVVS